MNSLRTNTSKLKKQYHFKLFQRKSLLARLKPKHHLSHCSNGSRHKFKRISRLQCIIHDFHRLYNSLYLLISFIFRLFIVIDKITRDLFTFIEKIIQIIRVIHGWIQMIQSILSALYIIISRIVKLCYYIHQIFHLLGNLLLPFTNRTFEKTIKSFSNVLFYYYSSDGGCYTLQARTRHIFRRVRARWKKPFNYISDGNDEDNDYPFYDAISEESC